MAIFAAAPKKSVKPHWNPNALFPDYLSDSPWTYVVSAIIGILVVGVVVYLLVYLMVKLFSRGSEAIKATETTA